MRNSPKRQVFDRLIFQTAEYRGGENLTVELNTGRVIAKNSSFGKVVIDVHLYDIYSDAAIMQRFRQPSVRPLLIELWKFCLRNFLDKRYDERHRIRIVGRLKGTNRRSDIPNLVWDELDGFGRGPKCDTDFIEWNNNVIRLDNDIYVDVKVITTSNSSGHYTNSPINQTEGEALREYAGYLNMIDSVRLFGYPTGKLSDFFEGIRRIQPGLTDAELRRGWQAVYRDEPWQNPRAQRERAGARSKT
jgi:hypothetical protein